MSELCWFCKKKSANREEIFEVPFYKITAKRTSVTYLEGGTVSRTGYNYLTATVLISRCGQCAAIHAKVSRIKRFKWWIGGIGTGLIIVVWFILNSNFLGDPIVGYTGPAMILIWLIGVNLAVKRYCLSQKTQPSDIYKHPEVDRLLKDGYVVGFGPDAHLKYI